MREELDILKIVAGNPSISQRKIAEQAGISLGQVNFLIKKFVKKGLIKIEGQNTKSLRYNLTPQGLAEKADRTLKYMKISYKAVLALTDKIRTIAEEYESEGYDIYVYGPQDEMLQMIKLALHNYKVQYLTEIQDIYSLTPSGVSDYKVVILCWEAIELSEIEGNKVVNILE